MRSPVVDTPRTLEASAVERGPRGAKLLAASLFAVAVTALLVTLVFYQLTGRRTVVVFVSGPSAVLAATVAALAFAGLGLALVLRRPRNAVGWTLLMLGVLIAVPGNLVAGYASYAQLTEPPKLPAPEVIAWLGALLTTTVGTLLFSVLFLIFPSGQFSSPRSRTILGMGLLGALVWTAGAAVEPGALVNFPSIANPFGATGWLATVAAITARMGAVILTGALLSALASMAFRFRVAAQRERQQLKWFALGGALVVTTGTAFGIVRAVSPTSPIGEALLIVALLSWGLIPTTVTIAIVRHQLYDIDELISATVVYGALTAILAGIYTASIRLFNSLFVAVTGETSDAALVVTTLILAASFTPIKERLEAIVKSRYPPEPTPDAPSHSAAEADLDDRIRRVVREELDEQIRRVVRQELARDEPRTAKRHAGHRR